MEISKLNGKKVIFCCDGEHCRKETKKIRKALKDAENIQVFKTACLKKCGKCPVLFLADASGGQFLLEASVDKIKTLLGIE